MYSLNDRIAIVTGGAKGIGEAIVRKLAAAGATVIIFDIETITAQNVADEINKIEAREAVTVIECDIVKRSQAEQAVAAVIEKYGRIDILVNNAGIISDAIFHKMTEEQWDKVMLVNGKGLFNCTQEVYKHMKDRQYGKILNISSNNSSGAVGQANYSFTKAGILAFTKTLAMEAGRSNINVNAIRPGFIDSEMLRSIPEKAYKAYEEGTAFKRVGQPSEVANLAAFLCSDEASWITGEEIICAGGLSYRS
jgi:3-oxoacyl-[acyl-carrier protein] reductase